MPLLNIGPVVARFCEMEVGACDTCEMRGRRKILAFNRWEQYSTKSLKAIKAIALKHLKDNGEILAIGHKENPESMEHKI
jgi:hypothetical protein